MSHFPNNQNNNNNNQPATALDAGGGTRQVRLAKEKTSNKLYAVKIMNKDFLKKRQARDGKTTGNILVNLSRIPGRCNRYIIVIVPC